jgi:hypothetical protein
MPPERHEVLNEAHACVPNAWNIIFCVIGAQIGPYTSSAESCSGNTAWRRGDHARANVSINTDGV